MNDRFVGASPVMIDSLTLPAIRHFNTEGAFDRKPG